MKNIEMSGQEYRMFRDYLQHKSGLYFSEGKMNYLQNRISKRVDVHRLETYKGYYDFLTQNPTELRTLLGVLTVNDTAFFRHPQQFGVLRSYVIPRVREKNEKGKKISIWSAGCANGAEAYSIAISAAEAGLEPGWDVRILATDIDEEALATGRSGRYESSMLRLTEADLVERYFHRQGDLHEIKPEIKKTVSFEYGNLIEEFKVRDVDILFCRNTMIYFTLEDKMRLVDKFYGAVADGGFFFMSPTESLHNRGETFEVLNIEGTLIYRKE